mgnify:CR=1 FL=1
MKFLTWNIQSGGGSRLPSIVEEIARLEPDFVALTEVTFTNLAELRQSLNTQGLHFIETTCTAGRKNSVLIASKTPFKLDTDSIDHDQERWLSASFDDSGLKVLTVHIPGATDNKFDADGFGMSGKKRKELFWDEVLRFATQHGSDDVVLLGDFNTGLKEDAQGTPFELSEYMRVLRLEKYVDTWRMLNPKTREYTWFTKRKNKETGTSDDYNGFRLDYIFVSPSLREKIVTAEHVHSARIDKLSDHAIVLAELAI